MIFRKWHGKRNNCSLLIIDFSFPPMFPFDSKNSLLDTTVTYE
jgi:hypothetical protein